MKLTIFEYIIIVGSQEMKLFGDREEERFVHFSNHQF